MDVAEGGIAKDGRRVPPRTSVAPVAVTGGKTEEGGCQSGSVSRVGSLETGVFANGGQPESWILQDFAELGVH
eukprot:7675037-Pyramimonas_sp.AAC.1